MKDQIHRPEPVGQGISPTNPKRLNGIPAALIGLMVALSLVFAVTPQAGADPTTPTTDSQASDSLVPMGTIALPAKAAKNPAPSASGYIPPSYDTSAINDGKYSSGLQRASVLPAAYDLRTAHPTWLAGVGDQGTWGTCWTFAASESAETSLVRNGVLTGNEPALARQVSRLHLLQSVYYTNTYTPKVTNPLAPGGAYQLGGNDFMAAAAWAHWYGAQTEARYPYPTDKSVAPLVLSNSQLKSSAYYLRNQWILPAPRNSDGVYVPANVTTIKQAVFQYGGVDTAFTGSHLNVAPYYNSATKAFYDPTKATSDHAVLIIGWDDNFAASNFTTTPPGNGAFIIQNSWGANTSYFYLSYYDTTMVTSSVFDLQGTATTSDYHDPYGWTDQYAYDELGMGTAISYPTTASAANKFTARADSTLRAVQFIAPEPSINYSISVYTGTIKSGSPVSGGSAQAVTASGGTTLSGSLTYAGYNTVTLGKPVALKKGQQFSVVITQTDPAKQSLVPVEYQWDNPYYSTNLTISSDQSFMQYNGAWYDLVAIYKSWNQSVFGNANIIALTSPGPTYTLNFNANGSTVSPSSKTVTFGAPFGTLPTPAARTDYLFAGWYTAASGGSLVTSSTVMMDAADKTIYARWTATKYTLTFNANGGTVQPTSKTVTLNAPLGQLPTPAWAGYTFAGWFTAKSGGSVVTSSTVLTVPANLTIYAHWTAKKFTVKFNANKGSTPKRGSKAYKSKIVTFGKAYGALPTTKRSGYKFLGWFTAKSGGTKVTTTTLLTKAGNLTLYAHWKRTKK